MRCLLARCCLLLLASVAANAWAGPPLAQCNGVKDLVFVPHQDDDLLFMNPDVQSTVNAGGCLQVVYLTASDRGEGESYMLGRERGVRAAYAYIAHKPNDWTESVSTFGKRHLARFTLDGNRRITLLHMRLEDPWLGKGWGSLTPLSRAESVVGQTAQSIGVYSETYTRIELVAIISAIIDDYRPTTIRHMDDTITIPYAALCWRCAGHDHPDHIASARLVRDAMKLAPGNYAEVGYVDYPSQEREANLTQIETSAKTDAFLHYAWNDYRYCPDPALCRKPAGPEASWVSRIYYVSRRNAPPVLVPALSGYSLFVVGEHNRAANVWHSQAQQWSCLGGRTADPIMAFGLGTDRVGVFARDATGRLWVTTRNAKGVRHGWQALEGARLTRLPSITNQAPLAIVAMGNDGRYHYAVGTNSGDAWSSWAALARLPHALPKAAITHDGDGRFAVFAADAIGKVWTSSLSLPAQKHAAVPATWTPWRTVGKVKTSGGMAAMRNESGRIELYLRDQHTGHMLRLVQLKRGSADRQWATPVDLGFSYVGLPALTLNEQGAVTVAALEYNDGPLWLVDAGQATKLPGNFASPPTLRVLHERLFVAARSTGPDQNYRIMTRASGMWTASTLITAPPASGGGAFQGTEIAPLRPATPVAPAALSARADTQ